MRATGMSFNESHPELRPSEVFLCNDAPNYGFVRVKAVLLSARLGKTAYDSYGNDLTDKINSKPIFVDRDELEATGGPLMLEVRYNELKIPLGD